MGFLDDIWGGLFGKNVNANPFTGQMMDLLTGQQKTASSQMGSLINQSLSGFDPTAFLRQFQQNAGGLAGIAGQDYSDLMKGAKDVGNLAVQDVASQFAGLGSLYSGGAAKASTEALANPMMSAYLQGAGQRSNLLNTLFGTGLSGLQSGNVQQMLGGLQGAGLYGNQNNTLLQLLGGYGDPLMQAQPGLFQYLLQGLAAGGSAAGGAASLAKAGGFPALFG